MNSSILNNRQIGKIDKLIIYNNNGKILLYNNPEIKSKLWELLPFSFLEEKKNKSYKLKKIFDKKFEQTEFEFNINFKNRIINFYSCKFTELNDLKTIQSQKKYCWVDLVHLIKLDIREYVLLNISKLIGVISNNFPKLNIIKDFENEFTTFYKLKKKNERVYYSLNSPSGFTNKQMYLLKEIALAKKEPLVRVCFHRNNNEKIHEMLMVHSRPQKIGPLRQINHESLTYFSIDGEALIKTYSTTGSVKETFKIHSNKKNYLRMCRVDSKITRTIESLSEYFIFLEICSGPFEDNHTIWE